MLTANSTWYTPTPFAISVASFSSEVPTAILDAVTDPVITHIEITNGPVYISLDGFTVSPSVYDFKLDPITAGGPRYQFLTSPDLMLIMSPGGAANMKIGYEAGLVSQYVRYRPVTKTFQTAPGTASGLDLGLVNGSPDTFATVIQVKGDQLIVTLDGRTPTSSSYDFILDPGASETREAAYTFNVAPDQIRVLQASSSTQWKYGYEEYQKLDPGAWFENPIYAYSGFR